MKISTTFKGKCAMMHTHLKSLEHDLSQEALNFILESDMYNLYLIGFGDMTAVDINDFVAEYIRKEDIR